MRKTNYEKLGALMTERKFLPKDLNISSRQINYWKGKLVLPFFTNEKKRGYMSFSEAFWMLIVNELSNVGINSKKIETLSENIWVIPMKEKYADKVFKEHLKNNKDYLTEEEREAIKSFLNNVLFKVEI